MLCDDRAALRWLPMVTTQPTILATSGGYRPHPRLQVELGPLIRYAVELSGVHGRVPRVTHLGTAGGDAVGNAFHLSQAARVAGFDLSHLNLFPMPSVEDVEGHLMEQDVVWVGGGSVANLLAVWRVHGLDEVLPRVWQAGIVLSGVSAGSICWYDGGTTDSFGPQLEAVTNGLGLLPYGNGVHYDSEAQRRPLLHRLVGDGTLPLSYATDDGVGLVYRGSELVEAVTDREGAHAYRVERSTDGTVTETVIAARLLE